MQIADSRITTSLAGSNVSDLEGALTSLRLEEGGSDPVLDQPTARGELQAGAMEIVWRCSSFGQLKITVETARSGNFDKATLGKVESNRLALWAPIEVDDEPETVTVYVKHELKPGLKLFHSAGGNLVEYGIGSVPPMNVHVTWSSEDAGPRHPHTRERDKDNFDLVLMNESGEFVQLQVSVNTRHGRFWITVQEVFAGQVITTTPAKASRIDLTKMEVAGKHALVVPISPYHAYTGADYLRTFPKMGPKLVQYAVEHKATVALSKCPVVTWEPTDRVLPDSMAQKSWKKATVLFFNLAVGFGRGKLEDGQIIFLHFSRILDEDGQQIGSKGRLPALMAMDQIAVRTTTDEQGRLQAKSIRHLK